MSILIAFPKINPILMFRDSEDEKLFENSIPTHEEQVLYRQKVEQGDFIYLIFAVSNTVGWTFTGALYDCEGDEVTDSDRFVTIELLVTTVSVDFDYYKVTIETETIPDGIYRFGISCTPDSGGDPGLFLSEPLYIREEWLNTIMLRYANETNDFDIPFEDISDFRFALRVEGGFPSEGYSPNAKDVIYIDQIHDPYLLDSTPFDIHKCQFGWGVGLPNWMAGKLNRAFACTHMYIDGQRYNKAEGAKLEATRDRHYPMAGWTMDLMMIDDFYSDEVSLSKVYVLGYGEIAFRGGDEYTVTIAKSVPA